MLYHDFNELNPRFSAKSAGLMGIEQNDYMSLKYKCAAEIIDRNLDLKNTIGQINRWYGDNAPYGKKWQVPEEVEEIFQICCIYLSYRKEDGFRLKTSFFKHSCRPNAVILRKPMFQIRAIANIKKGKEINLNWCSDQFFGFLSKIQRQKSILNGPPYVRCSCDFCEKDVDIDHWVSRG